MAKSHTPFKKVLVANRGEIAVRVIRTLHEMGIGSVAVYSDADVGARHVTLANEAVRLGPAPSNESYLLQDRIIDAAKKTGADAIHPGYGFLSENAEFARSLSKAGIVFIGPDPDAIEQMGNKTHARALMIKAGVPVVPGVEAGSAEELQAGAKELGYPIMLKAASGGGGKGMRLVHAPGDLAQAFERARSEAQNAFGDPTVYAEKAILAPRHVEIQVLADRAGNTVHLFERDCSIQRRHQKVIEETPSPFSAVTDDLVDKMGEVAVRAAKAVGYHSVGTVEFLVDEAGNFYFLEMNTRLQVEHPITELITGMDLVREQIRVAQGENLDVTQADIVRRGHAIECRIYAENPAAGFVPSPGTIERLVVPAGPGVRDDSSAFSGADVTSYYDPLVSKLAVWATTRPQAIARMKRALSEYVLLGLTTNLAFHRAVMDHAAFREGDYDTSFIEKNLDELIGTTGANATVLALAGAAHAGERERAACGQPSSKSGRAEFSAWRQQK